MTQATSRGGSFVKFELRGDLKAAFLAICRKYGVSQTAALNMIIEAWWEEELEIEG